MILGEKETFFVQLSFEKSSQIYWAHYITSFLNTWFHNAR